MSGSLTGSVYAWFGGGLSTIAMAALLIAGFVYLTWWIPLVSLVGSLFVAGMVYGALPLGPVYVVFGFPGGVLLGALWVFLK